MAERVGFEPTVPLPGRMLSKHVDSSTLAPLRIEKCKGRHLSTHVLHRQGEGTALLDQARANTEAILYNGRVTARRDHCEVLRIHIRAVRA